MRIFLHDLSRWVAGISLFVASILGFVSETLFDEDSFAERLGAAMDDSAVRSGLSSRAVDIGLDSVNADALLAESLPEGIRPASTPILELSKPAVAAAGAELLGVDAVQAGLETAARSVHRQTVTAILSDQEVDVVLNTRPVLVVTADAILGPAGARAAVGADIPDSVTSINLGSNQSPLWVALEVVVGLAVVAFALWLLSLVVYFSTAESGTRVEAARTLGGTFFKSGLAILVVAVVVGIVAGLALEAALATGAGVTLANLQLGRGSDASAGIALGSILFEPMLAGGRRVVALGLVLIAGSYLFGDGALARGFRTAVRTRSYEPIEETLRVELPPRLAMVRLWINIGFIVSVIAWSAPSLRAVLTLSGLALAMLAALSIWVSDTRPWRQLRQVVGWSRPTATDSNERTPRATSVRRMLWWLTVAVALAWPSYAANPASVLVVLVAAVFAASYFWETAPARARVKQADRAAQPRSEPWSTRKKTLAGALAVLLLLILVSPGDGGARNPVGAAALERSTPASCNGHAELCSVPLDEVVFAGTHNSMSASELGWELANHEGAIPAQLDGGIRALLIDVQKWEVDVNLDELEFDAEARALAEASLSEVDPPEDGLWMCHSLCQLGGTPFQDFLADLRAFVEANPDEVVIVIIQDEAEKADIKAAIERADLVPYAVAHELGTPWPTLGELIEADTRLLFMAENDADPDGWYQPVYEGNVEETGFRYDLVEDFDCAPNRGEDGSPLLLVNHWVETGIPVPDEADRVNSAPVLRERVSECERVRGRSPSVIAVNFWERGDLLGVVDELNGVS